MTASAVALLARAPWPAAGPALAGEDTGKAGPLGLLVLILLGIACYFLFRSMSGHLRRVREGFPASAKPGRPIEAPLEPGAAGYGNQAGETDVDPAADPGHRQPGPDG